MRPMPMRRAAASAGILFLALAAWPAPQRGALDPVAEPVIPRACVATTPAAPVTPTLAASTPRAERTLHLALPDGTSVPPLNGVERPAILPWPPHRPWSPIVGKETDEDGVQWYVHADGSSTTTQMAWHPQLGRLDPVTIVLNPVAKTAVRPEPVPLTSTPPDHRP